MIGKALFIKKQIKLASQKKFIITAFNPEKKAFIIDIVLRKKRSISSISQLIYKKEDTACA